MRGQASGMALTVPDVNIIENIQVDLKYAVHARRGHLEAGEMWVKIPPDFSLFKEFTAHIVFTPSYFKNEQNMQFDQGCPNFCMQL